MTRFEEIIARAGKIGLPIAHNEFIETKKTPLPQLPFIIWFSSETSRGDDSGTVKIIETNGSIELYTDRVPDPEKETLIETKVLQDVKYNKFQALISEENMVQTAYEFATLEKRRSKNE